MAPLIQRIIAFFKKIFGGSSPIPSSSYRTSPSPPPIKEEGPTQGHGEHTGPFTIEALQAARNPARSGTPKPMVYSQQNEVEGPMHVVWGQLPNDIGGHAFFLSPNGAPGSSYPIPEKLSNGETNPEWGANILAGYGYLMRLDFDQPGEVRLKSRMLQAPSWFADSALGNFTRSDATQNKRSAAPTAHNLDLKAVARQMLEEGTLHETIQSSEIEGKVDAVTLKKARHKRFVSLVKDKRKGVSELGQQKLVDELVGHGADLLQDLIRHHHESTQGKTTTFEQLRDIFLGFNYGGNPRYSLLMGFGEQLNTALTPVNFGSDASGNRLLATSDFGRHWYINPQSLALAAPLAPFKEYQLSPSPLPWVFPIVLDTAHPVFDPHTKEYFGFNFTQKPHVTNHPRWHILISLLIGKADALLGHLEHWLENEFKPRTKNLNLDRIEDHAEELLKSSGELVDQFNSALDGFLEEERDEPMGWTALGKQLLMGAFKEDQEQAKATGGLKEEAFFTYYRHLPGQEPEFKKVRLVDSDGNPVVISQAAHQLGLTQDHVMVINAAFKTTMDVALSLDYLFNYPVLWNPVEKLLQKLHINLSKGQFLSIIRMLTTSAQQPNTQVYVAKRSDLTEAVARGRETITVQQFRTEPEYVHALTEYEAGQDEMTYYSLNNAALCVAEWLRWYDEVQLEGGKTEPLDPSFVGMVNSTAMDVGRLGKFRLDLKAGKIIEDRMLAEPTVSAYDNDQSKTHPSTWGIGLYGYHQYLSTTATTDKIKNIFVISGSPDYKRVTKFIYNLYRIYDPREVPANRILEVAKGEHPMNLLRLETDGMTLADHFVFPNFYYLYSTQFIPKTTPVPEGTDPSLHGYVLCLMLNQEDYQGKGDQRYYREFWLFDAANLKQGPVTVLGKPNLYYVFGLHSAWMPNLDPTVPEYTKQDMQADYGYLVKGFKDKYIAFARKHAKMLLPAIYLYFHWLEKFLEEGVYEPFQQYRNGKQ